jgi:putative FmdB family regulatory protein
MPIYEYECKNCQHTLDALQKIADDRLVDCPECGEPALKRLLSAPRFRLKGQGWYETDFKSDNQRNLATDKEPAKAGDSKSATADSGKSEKAADSAKSAKAESAKSEKKASPKSKSDSKASAT